MMMSDLPERLRTLAEVVTACEWDLPVTAHDDLLRAAEEIERLKASVADLEARSEHAILCLTATQAAKATKEKQ